MPYTKEIPDKKSRNNEIKIETKIDSKDAMKVGKTRIKLVDENGRKEVIHLSNSCPQLAENVYFIHFNNQLKKCDYTFSLRIVTS